MSSALQANVLACWNSLPVDHNRVHQIPPSELVALNYDNTLQREDLEFYSFIFSCMRQGSYLGMAKAEEHKKRKGGH